VIPLLKTIKENREMGAIELTLFAINEALKLNEKDITKFSNELGNIRLEMAPFSNIGKLIKSNQPSEIKTVLKGIRTKILVGESKIIKNAKKYIKGKRIISISYSSTVIKAIISQNPEKVYWLKSLPGGEGKRSAEILGNNGIYPEVLNDLEMGQIMRKVDIIISGADAYSDKFIVNKVGTLPLFIVGNYYKKEIWVITHSLKRVQKTQIKTPIFELVPIKLITGIITDEGVWKQN